MVKAGQKEIGSSESDSKFNPIVGVVIAFLVIAIIYYFVWRFIAFGTTDVLKNALTGYTYDAIETSGFPFVKKTTLKNVVFKSDSDIFNRTQAVVNEVVIESFIFSRNMEMKFEDMKVVNIEDKNVYNVVFNEPPKIELSLYSDDRLKSFEYADKGIRVIDTEYKTLYTSGATSVKVESVKNHNIIDYSVLGSMYDLMNLQIFNLPSFNKDTQTPNSYGINFEISLYVDKADGVLVNTIMKMPVFNLSQNNNNIASLTADLTKDKDDFAVAGVITLNVDNYKNILENYKKETLDYINDSETVLDKKLTAKERKAYVNISNAIFKRLYGIIERNKSTIKDKVGVMVLKRDKGDTNYFLNDENIITITQDIMLMLPLD